MKLSEVKSLRKFVKVSEAVMTPLEPRRTTVLADECLVELRVIESKREAAGWKYEYEVSGEVGKVEKFLLRLRDIEQK